MYTPSNHRIALSHRQRRKLDQPYPTTKKESERPPFAVIVDIVRSQLWRPRAKTRLAQKIPNSSKGGITLLSCIEIQDITKSRRPPPPPSYILAARMLQYYERY